MNLRLPLIAALVGSGGLLLAAPTAKLSRQTGIPLPSASPQSIGFSVGAYARCPADTYAFNQTAQACALLGRQR